MYYPPTHPPHNHPSQCPPPGMAPQNNQPMYYGPPSAASSTYPQPFPYNNEWSLADDERLLHNANQTSGEQSTTLGHVPAASNGRVQCKWCLAGGPCNQQFDNFNDLVVHAGSDHDVRGSASRRMPCQWLKPSGYICGKNYRRDGYRRHLGTHVGCSVPCLECGKSFSRPDSLRDHQRKLHGKQ